MAASLACWAEDRGSACNLCALYTFACCCAESISKQRVKRAFFAVPARHDMARRVDCASLARLVSEHRLGEDEAVEIAHALGVWAGEKGVSAVNLVAFLVTA